MSAMPPMFAAMQLKDALDGLHDVTPGMRQTLIVLAAVGAVVMWIVVWMLFIRKPRRRHHRHHHGHHHGLHREQESSSEPAVDATATGDEDEPSHQHRRKWRRPRREHRLRNPTLAETGGLPPARTGDPPEILP